mmetsp:Transcript_35669/g.72954  ORF Transcript_35669/g.72954 Transcript_35669/m.72954 type:complete len:139 (-) Transcript_35669:839-1255(-)
MTALQNILGSLQTKSDSKGTLCDILNQQSVSSQCTIIKQVQEGKVTDERVVKSVDKSNEGKSPGRFILWYQLQNILLEALESASLVDENFISLGCEFQSYSFDNSTKKKQRPLTRESNQHSNLGPTWAKSHLRKRVNY